MATAIQLQPDVWYSVTEEITDPLGYKIKPGAVQFLRSAAFSQMYDMAYMRNWDGKMMQYERGWFVAKSDPWTNRLTPITGTELEEFQQKLERSKRHHPHAFVNMASGVTMGSDPECFVTDKDGALIPAFSFLKPQDKKAPAPLKDSSEKPAPPYYDGFQAEFQITPFGCIAYGTDRIQGQLKELQRLANAHSAGAKIVGHPVMAIPTDLMEKATDEHAALGCMPSMNAYNLQGEQVEDGRALPWRFAGWHIHCTLTDKQKPLTTAIIKMMDHIVGVTSVAVLAGLENPVRRKYYGLAGEYRTPSYGVEYRTLSSAALWHPALVHLHFNFARGAMQMATANLNLWEGSEEETVEIINTLDVDAARKAVERNRDLLTGLLRYYYILPNIGKIMPANVSKTFRNKYVADNASGIFDALMLKGASQFIKLDMEDNWHLTDELWQGHSETPGAQMWKFGQEIACA